MKAAPFVIILLLAIACSPSSNKESASADSLALDTLHQAIDEVSDIPKDTSQLNTYFESKVQSLETLEKAYFRVTIETSQYEAISHVIWFFDKDFAPRHFVQTWAAEGNEGSIELMVEEGSVICMSEDDGYEPVKWCKVTGGIRQQRIGDGTQTSAQLVPDTFEAESNERLNSFLNTLKEILKEGDITNPGEDTYTIKIEKPFEDSEFKETVEVSIAKVLYDELMK